jgi:hypothetical protein
MIRSRPRNRIILILIVVVAVVIGNLHIAWANHDEDDQMRSLPGRIVAVGIPGASAISAVGSFLPPVPPLPGPIYGSPFTLPGQVLDPVRILVGSTSNFGAPVALPAEGINELPGSILSIDPGGASIIRVPDDFAVAGGQAVFPAPSQPRVIVFTANNAAFLNGVKNPSAVTADFPGTSNPLGLSINNGFGRLWPANAPTGLKGIGTSGILDPQGYGLAGPPNPKIGGIYAGNLTNRGMFPPSTSQVIPGGLNTGAVGTALLGPSPDNSNRAVFAVVEADGSIVQEHTLQGLDGLAPPGTISPLTGRHFKHHRKSGDNHAGDLHGVSPRLGVVLAWTPSLKLFVSEPFENRIATLALTHDSLVFRVGEPQYIESEAFDQPVDLAPVVVETESKSFAGNTSLYGDGSDIYVANRGNNTIVRIGQNGSFVGIRRVTLDDGSPLGDARINGIATDHGTPDQAAPATKIWVTVTGHIPGIDGSDGAVIELPAF